jgi:hypothetical protein
MKRAGRLIFITDAGPMTGVDDKLDTNGSRDQYF